MIREAFLIERGIFTKQISGINMVIQNQQQNPNIHMLNFENLLLAVTSIVTKFLLAAEHFLWVLGGRFLKKLSKNICFSSRKVENRSNSGFSTNIRSWTCFTQCTYQKTQF